MPILRLYRSTFDALEANARGGSFSDEALGLTTFHDDGSVSFPIHDDTLLAIKERSMELGNGDNLERTIRQMLGLHNMEN